MKQSFILLILLYLVTNVAYSQTAHNVNCGACVYNKNYNGGKGVGVNSETCSCIPCTEKRNKEKAAKQAELTRRREALNAKIKAETEAKAKAFAAEQKRKQEEAAKPKSGEVLINAQSTTTTQSKNFPKGETIKVAKSSMPSSIMSVKHEYANNNLWSTVLNEKGEILFKTSDFYAYDWSNREVSVNNSNPPQNMIIVKNSSKGYNLVNLKGENLLTEGIITYIMYCGNNFILYTYDDGNGYLGYVNAMKSDERKKYPFELGKPCGSKMVIYDIEKNKKHFFEPNDKVDASDSYCVEGIRNSNSGLFQFSHLVLVEKKNRVFNTFVYENYIVTNDRQIKLVSTTTER